ncbi:MAG: hypothetical protein ACRELF_27300, partial [Gemmataceae bacterium]
MPHAEGETPDRLMSLDALRGFVMLALAFGGLGLPVLARQFPGHPLWCFLAGQCKHASWLGCSFADLIQPLFLFIVGVALSLSRARRQGQGRGRLAWRTLRRAASFVVLGVLFEATKSGGFAISFVNVLAQIGLGYPFVALLAGRRFLVQLVAVVVILLATWLTFALYPLPASARGAEAAACSSGRLPGFSAHWNKHSNAAAAFDRWFLNLFPRHKA